MISNNPTKTIGIEKRWSLEINKRWRRFGESIFRELNRLFDQLTINRLEFDPAQLRAFIAYFQNQIDLLLVGSWQEKYQKRSYELAIQRSMDELQRQGARLTITDQDRLLASRIESFTSHSSLSSAAARMALLPIHQEALEFLFTRSFDALAGITDEMAIKLRNILFDGIEAGTAKPKLIKQIREALAISRRRAKLIAQTETIQAYQRSTINQSVVASEQLGEKLSIRWLTRKDSKVRQLHASFHGKLMTEKQSRINISLSPYNCRCALVIVIKESDTEKQAKRYKAERKTLQNLTP